MTLSAEQYRETRPLHAWVLFSGQADCTWLKILKPGFRHCFILMNDGRHWFSLDPMLHYMDLMVHHDVPAEFDFPAHLFMQGYCGVKVPVNRHVNKPGPLAFLTCVEVIKRVLGIHHPLILTPWQLFCHLKSQKFQKKESPNGKSVFSSECAGS